jgi:hypothetical protein
LESESEEKAAGEPGSETIVCTAPSWFTHVTAVPVFTVSTEGSNAKFLIAIEFPPSIEAGVAAGVESVWEEEQPATVHDMITKAIQAEQRTGRECADIIP